MAKLFKEETYKAMRKMVQKELAPMKKAIFEYHLEKIRRNKNARKHNQNKQ